MQLTTVPSLVGGSRGIKLSETVTSPAGLQNGT